MPPVFVAGKRVKRFPRAGRIGNLNLFVLGEDPMTSCRFLICSAFAVGATAFVLISLGHAEDREFNGSGNNLANMNWGAAKENFARLAPVDYADGISAVRDVGRPNPRAVGVALMQQTASRPSARNLSGYVYAFGNFISHDSQATATGRTERIDFTIPFNDDMFPPGVNIPLGRSEFDPEGARAFSFLVSRLTLPRALSMPHRFTDRARS